MPDDDDFVEHYVDDNCSKSDGNGGDARDVCGNGVNYGVLNGGHCYTCDCKNDNGGKRDDKGCADNAVTRTRDCDRKECSKFTCF